MGSHPTVSLLAVLMLAMPGALSAQRDTNVDGAEICRPIWREFGRSMTGHPVAVYCEVRDIGTYTPSSRIEVDGGDNTGIRIRGAQRADARVRLVIQAQGTSVDDAKALAQKVRLDLSRTPLHIEGVSRREQRDDSRHFVSATIAIDAPEKADLWLRVNYAAMEVEGVRSTMDLRAQYGPITARDVGGDVRARVDYGPLTVELSGAKWDGIGLDAESSYGPMTLRVPKEFNADLQIGARHGPLDVDFPLTLSRLDGSLIETKLGAGGPRVRAVADYGPMSLQINR